MLAGTIVVQGGGLLTGAQQSVAGHPVEGPMRSAFQSVGAAACLGQHLGGHRHMLRFAAMGGEGQGNLLVGEAISFRRARFEQG